LWDLAKREADVQFRELIHEARLLVGLFPHLLDAYDDDELPLKFIIQRQVGLPTKNLQGKRRKTSGARGRGLQRPGDRTSGSSRTRSS
jgi:hypothetical protein